MTHVLNYTLCKEITQNDLMVMGEIAREVLHAYPYEIHDAVEIQSAPHLFSLHGINGQEFYIGVGQFGDYSIETTSYAFLSTASVILAHWRNSGFVVKDRAA